MDPNRYMEQRQKMSAPKPQSQSYPAQPANPQPVQRTNPAQPANPQPVQRTNPAQPVNPQPVQRTNSAQPVNPRPVQRTNPAQQTAGRIHQTQVSAETGKLQISGKRFFGQILIDRWVIRINGEQHEMSFGVKGSKTLELPAGTYLVTAYTPYLGMRCMRVSADVEIKPGKTSCVTYQTVFDIFNEGVLLS